MRKPVALLSLTILLLAAGCGARRDRSIDAEIEADFAKGEVLLSCKSSASGTCYAIFLSDGEIVRGEAAAGNAASIAGVGEGSDYCVGVELPNPARCRPRPLVAGKQIFRRVSGKRD